MDALAADATGTDTFTYTVSDGAGTTDTADLVITVTGVGPQAVADTGAVNEDATLTVNAASGVISNDDDNASYDVESLAITGISHGVTGNSGNAAQAVTGTYGVLTMAADGSYEYVANQAAADALDPGDQVTDVFTYTVKDDDDKNASTATLTITVTGINDDITAVDDTDAVNAGATITQEARAIHKNLITMILMMMVMMFRYLYNYSNTNGSNQEVVMLKHWSIVYYDLWYSNNQC